MLITWYGHSCFLLENSEGVKILTDPCDPDTGYSLANLSADIVTVSHNHHDHSYIQAVSGNPDIIDTVGEHNTHGVKIDGVLTYHDEFYGRKRGENIFYVFEIDGMRVAHAGDIGDIPDAATLDKIGKVDVLFVPIGGIFTIGAEKARELANLLEPSVLIPMHYKTDKLTFELDGIDSFVDSAVNCKIHRLNQSDATLTPENLGEDRILVLRHV